MSHGDQVVSCPTDFTVVAKTPTAPFAAIAHTSKPIYGIQFHAEVTHSLKGKEVIGKFVTGICKCKTDWTMVRLSLLFHGLRCPSLQWTEAEMLITLQPAGICWLQDTFIEKEIARIRAICGDKGQVIGAVSGGVDSSVAAKLMHEAIGDR
jgi:GMP synthase (glutamine-hydrolysing)